MNLIWLNLNKKYANPYNCSIQIFTLICTGDSHQASRPHANLFTRYSKRICIYYHIMIPVFLHYSFAWRLLGNIILFFRTQIVWLTCFCSSCSASEACLLITFASWEITSASSNQCQILPIWKRPVTLIAYQFVTFKINMILFQVQKISACSVRNTQGYFVIKPSDNATLIQHSL